jgi:hypothetical protein
MTTIAILPDRSGIPGTSFRAVSGTHQSVGKTAGQALDALAEQLDPTGGATLVVVQPMQPDQYFTQEQQKRLEELMTRWREARDAGTTLDKEEQAELESLVEAELRGATERATALCGMAP